MITQTQHIEGIWQAAESCLADYKACVIRQLPQPIGGISYLASGRYTTRPAAHRAATRVQSEHPDSNVYVVIRGRGDDFVVYLDAQTTF